MVDRLLFRKVCAIEHKRWFSLQLLCCTCIDHIIPCMFRKFVCRNMFGFLLHLVAKFRPPSTDFSLRFGVLFVIIASVTEIPLALETPHPP